MVVVGDGSHTLFFWSAQQEYKYLASVPMAPNMFHDVYWWLGNFYHIGVYRWHSNIILWYGIYSIFYTLKRGWFVVYHDAAIFTSLLGSSDMTHLPHDGLPYSPNFFYMLLIGFGFLLLHLHCLNWVISEFTQRQFSVHDVEWLNMFEYGHSTKGTHPYH